MHTYSITFFISDMLASDMHCIMTLLLILVNAQLLFLYTEWTQKIQAKNAERLVEAVMERPEGTSLLTVCNHLSYLDDTAFYRK